MRNIKYLKDGIEYTFLISPSLNLFVGNERMVSSEAPRGAAGRSVVLTTTLRMRTTQEQQQNNTPRDKIMIWMIIKEKHMRKRYGAVDVHRSSARAWNVQTIPTMNHVNHRKFNILLIMYSGEVCLGLLNN